MDLFNSSGMRERVESLVLQDHIPILGVCVGMQILANSSEEGTKIGIGWIPGTVKKFKATTNLQQKLPLPHMGWNDVIPSTPDNFLFKNLENDSRFYFLHSYYFECEDINEISAITEYGISFSSAINKGNI